MSPSHPAPLKPVNAAARIRFRCLVDLFLTLRSEILARTPTVEAWAEFLSTKTQGWRPSPHDNHQARRSSPPKGTCITPTRRGPSIITITYLDSARLRKLLLRDFNDPEVLREWHEAVERLRYSSPVRAGAAACVSGPPEAAPSIGRAL